MTIRREAARTSPWPLRVIASARATPKAVNEDTPETPPHRIKELQSVDRRERAKRPGLY